MVNIAHVSRVLRAHSALRAGAGNCDAPAPGARRTWRYRRVNAANALAGRVAAAHAGFRGVNNNSENGENEIMKAA
jgi:hypothetical protein